ncbi:MAG: TetR family transcriptional regulator [Solirubrobacterales bacterium]
MGEASDPRPGFDAFRLPRGRHSLPREHVEENQRWRLIGAASDVLAEEGYLRVTARAVAHRAAVSTQTFYAQFENVGECLAAAFESSAERAEAFAQDRRRDRSKARREIQPELLADVFGFLSRPRLKPLLGRELRASVPAVAARHSRLVGSLALLVQDGRLERRPHRRSSIRSRLLVEGALLLLAEPPEQGGDDLAEQVADLLATW